MSTLRIAWKHWRLERLCTPVDGDQVEFRSESAQTGRVYSSIAVRLAASEPGPLVRDMRCWRRFLGHESGPVVRRSDEIQPLEKGFLVVVAPGTPHAVWSTGQQPSWLFVDIRPGNERLELAIRIAFGLAQARGDSLRLSALEAAVLAGLSGTRPCGAWALLGLALRALARTHRARRLALDLSSLYGEGRGLSDGSVASDPRSG